MKVSSQFSCMVLDSDDVQQYYFPRAVVNDATFVGDVVIDGDTTINGDIIIVGGAYTGYQREAILDVESTDGYTVLDVTAASYFNTTLTEFTIFSFENLPSVAEGYGQTWLLTIDNASAFDFGWEEDGWLIYRRAADSFADRGDTTKLVLSSCQVGNVFVVPLKDIVAHT
jgi:hypothetical protein